MTTAPRQHASPDETPRLARARRPLRVCHVMSADLWAGAEVQLATLASYLVERPEVKLSAVVFNDGWLADQMRRLGIEVAVVDERRHGALGIVMFLTRFLRAQNADIVHTHRYKDTVLGALAGRLAGVPHLVRTVHGLGEPMRGWALMKFQCYDALDKAALWFCADRVVAVSQSMAATLKASNYRASAVVHVHNGIDLRTVKASRAPEDVRRDLGIGLDRIVIGTAGRLSPVKGHEHLVRAAKLIAQQEDRARFLFIGNGPLKSELTTLARELGLADRCAFVDLQDHPRLSVYDVMCAMDVFVLPSLHEGIPMALLEAMALQTPVVASAVGGIPEVVTHRHDGLLVRSRDHVDLADACLELIDNPDLSQTFGARARRVVHDRFSRDANGEIVLDLYRQIASDDATGGTRTAGAPAGLRGLTGRVARRIFGTIEQTLERHRMNRIRRHPEALAARLKSAKSVLIVCHGNIIRSAFAARQLAQALGDDALVSISSAGLEAVSGRPSHPTAVLTAAPLQIDLTRHSAAPLRPAAVATADVIFVMDVQQLVALCRRFPDARAKTFLLTCLASDRPLEVRDPVDGDETVFQACFDHISGATRPIIRLLSAAVE